MLEKIKKQPSNVNLSSKIVKATAIQPTDVISKKYSGESLDIAKKASNFDEYADDLAKALESGASKLDTPKTNQIYNKAGKLIDISKLGKGAVAGLKVAGKIAVPLGIASDVLASSDLGSGEQSELEKMEKEKIKEKQFQKIFGDNKSKIEDIKKKSEEISSIPVRPSDLLSIKKIIPEPSKGGIGEQESPDLEEMDKVINYEDYMKKRKKNLGYE